MIAEIIIDCSAKKLDKTFDYNVPDEYKNSIMVGSTVIIPFGSSNKIIEGYVIGIKDNTEYEVKDIIEVKRNFTDAQLELSKWMAKKYYCNVSDCLRLMLTPGTRLKKNKEEIKKQILQTVYLNKKIEDIEADIKSGKIKSDKQIKVLEYLKNKNGVIVSEITTNAYVTRGVLKTLEKKRICKNYRKTILQSSN